jgi:hypothetical protein
MSEKTIYDVERAKFEGFGTYKLPIEERVNEIMEATKKEYPNVELTSCRVSRIIISVQGCSQATLVYMVAWPPLGFEPNLILQQESSMDVDECPSKLCKHLFKLDECVRLYQCVRLLTPWKHAVDAGESRERLRPRPC